MLAPVTLLVISTLSSLVTQGVLGSLLRSGIAGIRELMWANVLVLCSLLLFTLQANPAMPPWLAIQAPNVLISSGVVKKKAVLRRRLPLHATAPAVAPAAAGKYVGCKR